MTTTCSSVLVVVGLSLPRLLMTLLALPGLLEGAPEQGRGWQQQTLPNQDTGHVPNQDNGHVPNQDTGHLPHEDPGHLPGLEESLQRRTMYPAGRILHLVPARLVFDADELARLGETCIATFHSFFMPCVFSEGQVHTALSAAL